MVDFVATHCFGGGLSLGGVQSGMRMVGSKETRPAFGTANSLANRHLMGYDWEAQEADYHEWEPVGDAPVIYATPPCSSFSLMSSKHFRGIDGPANRCMFGVIDFAARQRAEIVVLESVQQAYSQGRPLMQTLRARLEQATGRQYGLWHVKHNALALGGAPLRKRYMMVLSTMPFGVETPRPARLPVLGETISDLANLTLTWEAQPYRAPATWWTKQLRSDSGVVDGMMNLSNLDATRIGELLEWLENVHWTPGMGMDKAVRLCYEKFGDLPPSWATKKAKILENDFNLGFTLPTRWRPDKVARVITGQGVGQVVHPWLPRFLTHREVARIQGFPDDWVIRPNRGHKGMSAWWGKLALPVVGRWFGHWVQRAIAGEPGSETGELIGEREYLIDHTYAYKVAGCTEH